MCLHAFYAPALAAEQGALTVDAVILARDLPQGTNLNPPVLSLPDLSTVAGYVLAYWMDATMA